ncbi:tautomerase family protein [Altericista sp. CCNU0014]|uniref:tautomerase family protein n=1 Tax=Altericista sp. CCNU0014 TaxID=3082949 RepID=UPI0038513EA6
MMVQVKIYGLRDRLFPKIQSMSDTVHACLMETLNVPPDKRFHRFMTLEPETFLYPDDRTENYTILEISMFEGRTVETKKRLIRLLFERFQSDFDIAPLDLEITLLETPKANWGVRGMLGDEL